jgi:hypothetical protein
MLDERIDFMLLFNFDICGYRRVPVIIVGRLIKGIFGGMAFV